jgi:AcrR family transcriptional regulator
MDAARDEAPTPATERRAKIIREAANIFYEKGFAGACIDDLIAKVGGSKRTLYNEFGSKEGLFTAMVAALVSRHSTQLLAGLEADERSGADIRQVLTDYGRQLMRIVMDPEVLAFNRIIIAEGKRFPALAEAFFETGPARSIGRLAQILEHHRASGEIGIRDCQTAAEQFGGLLKDTFYFAVLLGVREPPSKAEMDRRADAAVALFLNGVASDPS